MKHTAFLRRACLWFFATVIFVGAGMVVVSSASAQTGEPDHLKCYQMRDTNPAKETDVKLFNQQFGQEGCTLVTKARLVCAPTVKNDGDDPRGGPLLADYLCYKVKCPKRDKTTHEVDDSLAIAWW